MILGSEFPSFKGRNQRILQFNFSFVRSQIWVMSFLKLSELTIVISTLLKQIIISLYRRHQFWLIRYHQTWLIFLWKIFMSWQRLFDQNPQICDDNLSRLLGMCTLSSCYPKLILFQPCFDYVWSLTSIKISNLTRLPNFYSD